MIKSFRSKQLAQLWAGTRSKIDTRLRERVLERLDALDVATRAEDMNIPGYRFHGLQGAPKRYTIHVNGPWCVTFEFADGDAFNVDLEQYH